MGLFSKSKPSNEITATERKRFDAINNRDGHLEAATRAAGRGDAKAATFHHEQRKLAEKEARRHGAWWVG